MNEDDQPIGEYPELPPELFPRPSIQPDIIKLLFREPE